MINKYFLKPLFEQPYFISILKKKGNLEILKKIIIE